MNARRGSSSSPNASLLTWWKTRLLVEIGRTFEPTRSGTGGFARSRQAHASGEVLPFIRTLLQTLHHGSQARLRTCPGVLGDRGLCLLRFQIGQQKGRIQVALHRPYSAGTRVPAL